ncbi:MAG TPA: universal stress protein [Gemmatimonadota bacterium]|nr:universal stress protein [Gemmatimonadota bacterium]
MRILVCSDGSSESGDAVAYASKLRTTEEDTFALLGIRAGEAGDASLLEALRDQQHVLRETGRSADLLTGTGEPVGEIEGAAEKGRFDLIVLGGHRRGRRLTTFGTSTYRMVRSLLPPVLVVPSRREAILRIVIAVGGVGRIERAVDVAAPIAAGVGARVTLLHVLAEPPYAYAPLVERYVEPETIPSRSDALSRLLGELSGQFSDRGVATDIRFRFGPVAEGILYGARDMEADLLVVGTSPAGGEIRRYLLGDLARDFLYDPPCPLLFVRTGTSLWRRVYRDFKGTIRKG